VPDPIAAAVVATAAAIVAVWSARLRHYDALALLFIFFCVWLAVFTACEVWGVPNT
jgi:hypothetical protein